MNNKDSPTTATNTAKRTRRNSSPILTQRNSQSLTSQSSLENNTVLRDIDLCVVFEKDIAKSAKSFVKMTYAASNYLQKIATKRDNIENRNWPNHIKSKIKDIVEPFQSEYAQKLIQDEIHSLE